MMSALISAGIDLAARHRLPVLEAYPIDPEAKSATRSPFPGVLRPFLRAHPATLSTQVDEAGLVNVG